MPNGSVEDHLSVKSEAPLSWAMRLKIAQDAARGLAYLHEEMEFQVILLSFLTFPRFDDSLVHLSLLLIHSEQN